MICTNTNSLLVTGETHQSSAKGSSCPLTPSIDIALNTEPDAEAVCLESSFTEVDASLVDSYSSLCAEDKKATVFNDRIAVLSASTFKSSILDLLLALMLKSSGNLSYANGYPSMISCPAFSSLQRGRLHESQKQILASF